MTEYEFFYVSDKQQKKAKVIIKPNINTMWFYSITQKKTFMFMFSLLNILNSVRFLFTFVSYLVGLIESDVYFRLMKHCRVEVLLTDRLTGISN